MYSEGLTLSALTVNGKVNASAAIYEANAGTGPGVTRAGAAELRSEINVRSGESYPKCLGFIREKTSTHRHRSHRQIGRDVSCFM